MNKLLPPNTTATERVIDAATQRTTESVPVPIRNIWNPDHCPVELLPWLAWTMSIDYWRSEWPEDVKRKMIRESITVHRHKGTLGSVRRAIESLGTRLHISEWFEHGGEPYTARIVAYVNEVLAEGAEIIDQEMMIDLLRIAEREAPVRVHFDLAVGADYRPQIITPGVLQKAATIHAYTASTNLESTHDGDGITATAAVMCRPTHIHSNLFITNNHDVEEQGNALFMPGGMLRRPVIIASVAGVTA